MTSAPGFLTKSGSTGELPIWSCGCLVDHAQGDACHALASPPPTSPPPCEDEHVTGRTARRIVFPAPQRVELQTFELPELGPGLAQLQSRCSLMSTGTENIAFNKLFEESSHWAQFVKYPFLPGYVAIADVAAVAPGVEDIRVGDRVAIRGNHASHHVHPAFLCTSVPEAIDDDRACWFALAKIAYVGARAAEYRLGDRVAVIGAGPIGQMSTRWANAAGARAVIVIDALESRLMLATKGGASTVVAGPVASATEAVILGCNGRRPRVIVDSTGNADVFASALALVADRGRVVVLGDTGFPATQHLTADVITRGITIVGAHDVHSMVG